MADTIQRKISRIRELFQEITVGEGKASRALNNLNEVFNRLASGQSANVTAKAYKKLFQEVIEGAEASKKTLVELGKLGKSLGQQLTFPKNLGRGNVPDSPKFFRLPSDLADRKSLYKSMGELVPKFQFQEPDTLQKVQDFTNKISQIPIVTNTAQGSLSKLIAELNNFTKTTYLNLTSSQFLDLFTSIVNGSELTRLSLNNLKEELKSLSATVIKETGFSNIEKSAQNINEVIQKTEDEIANLRVLPQSFEKLAGLFVNPNLDPIRQQRDLESYKRIISSYLDDYRTSSSFINQFFSLRDVDSPIRKLASQEDANRIKQVSQEVERLYGDFMRLQEGSDVADRALNKVRRTTSSLINYLGSSRQKELPLNQYIDRLSASFYPEDSISGFFSRFVGLEGSKQVLQDLNDFISKYGYSLQNIKNIQREATTGIARITFEKTLGLGDAEAIEKLNVAVSKTGQITRDTQRRFRTFASGLARDITEVIKWAIAVGVVYTPLRKLQDLIGEMIKNQVALSEIQIITAQSSDEVYKSFFRIADIAGKTAENVNSTLESFKLAYIAAGNIKDEYQRTAVATQLLNDSLILSKLSSLSATESLDILSAGLKQLGMDLNQGSTLLDKWIMVSREANVSIDTLATSFSIVSSAAENVGLNIDELNGVIAAAAEVQNMSARETGNMIRAFISGYQTDNAVRELASFGIAVKDVDGDLRSFMSVFRDIYRLSEQGLISESQLARITEILGGGARRGAQLASFIQNLDRISQVSQVSASAPAGTALQALQTRLDTVDTVVNKLSVSFSQLAQTLGVEGGFLEIVVLITENLTKLTNALTSVVKALGSATPAFTAGLASIVAFTGNKGLSAKFFENISKVTYGIGSAIGRLAYSTNIGGIRQSEITKGILPEMSPFGGFYNQQAEKRRISFVPGEDILEGLILTGQPAVAEKFGGDFVRFIQKRQNWVIPGTIVASTIINDLRKGDYTAVGGNIAGAFIGTALGSSKPFVSVFGTAAPTIGLLVGTAIARGFIEAARTSPDVTAGLSELWSKAYSQASIETTPSKNAFQDLIEQRAELERQLKIEAGKRLPFGRALGATNARGGLQEFLATTGFNLQTNIRYDLTKLISPDTVKDITREQYALQLILAEAPQELIDKYFDLQNQIYDFESASQGRISNMMSDQVTKVYQTYQDITNRFVEQNRRALFENVDSGVSSKQFRERLEFLNKIGVAAANIFNSVGEEFADSLGKGEDLAGAYEKLLELLLSIGNEELIQVTQYSGDIELLKKSFGDTSDEVKNLQRELSSLLMKLYSSKQIGQFKLPSIVGTVFTESEADLIAKSGREAAETFYSTFIEDKNLVDYYLSQLTPIAVQISQEAGKEASREFWKQYQEVDTTWFNFALKKLEKAGVIKPADIQIQTMTDITKDYFKTTIEPLARQFEDILIRGIYGSREKLPTENVAIIFKDGIGKVNLNLLALRLAQDKTNELLQKQLDGIFNLPEGAELWVPAQAAELALQTMQSSAGGISPIDFSQWDLDPLDTTQTQNNLNDLSVSANEASLALQNVTTIMDTFAIEKMLAEQKAGNLENEGRAWLERTFGSPPTVTPPLNLQGVSAVRETDRYIEEIDLNKKLMEEFFKKAYVPADTARPIESSEIFTILQKMIPTIDSIVRIVEMLTNINNNKMPTQPSTDITPRSTFVPTINTQPMSKIDLTVNTTSQVNLDGRLIVMALKRYLARDLRVAAGGRTSTNNFFV